MSSQRSDILKRLRPILAESLGVEEDEISLDTHVYEDLNADPIEFHDEVIPEIEDAFEVKIPDEDVPDLTTVGELVSYLAENT